MLDSKETEKIREDFLLNLGIKMRHYRERKNIPQSILAKCLGVSGSALSKYERGATDMRISNIPLLSIYCDFPMSDLFPAEASVLFLKSMRNAVSITAKRYKRAETKAMPADKRALKGRIYEVDGQEVIQYVSPITRKPSQRELYIQGLARIDSRTFNQVDLNEAVKSLVEKNQEVIYKINIAGTFLESLQNEN